MIYRATGNLRRGANPARSHQGIENTVRYLGVDVDDALDPVRADRHLTDSRPWRSLKAGIPP